MPFIGQDWRDPGECWIKTDLGWEPARLYDFWTTPVAINNKSTSVAAYQGVLTPIAPSATPPPQQSSYLQGAALPTIIDDDNGSVSENEKVDDRYNNTVQLDRQTMKHDDGGGFRNRSYAVAAAVSAPRAIAFNPKRMFDMPLVLSTSSPANNYQNQQFGSGSNKDGQTFLRDIENFNWRSNTNRHNNAHHDNTASSKVASNAKPPKTPIQQPPAASSSSAFPLSSGSRPRSTRMSLLIKRAEGFEVPDELLAGSSSDEDSLSSSADVSSMCSNVSYSGNNNNNNNKENMVVFNVGERSRETSIEKNIACSSSRDMNEKSEASSSFLSPFPSSSLAMMADNVSKFAAKKRTCSQSSFDSTNNALQNARKHSNGGGSDADNSMSESAPIISSSSSVASEQPVYQPYCYVVVRTTRERAGYTSIADAFCRLDFTGAAKDIRRFHYVCKVLDLLITQRLTKLGGQAQKYLFKTVEQVIEQVFSSEQNLDSLRQLLAQLDQAIHDSKYWGHHVGSSALWSRHRAVLHEWIAKVQRLQLKGRTDDNRAMLHDLPAECLRLVLLFLTDHRDVLSASEADPRFARFADERHLWYDLCWFHFKPYHLAAALKQQGKRLTESHDINARQNDWKALYYKLKRIHGLRESYPETVILCTHCKCLFWEDWGHPCVLQNADRRAERAVPLAPSAFVDLFAL